MVIRKLHSLKWWLTIAITLLIISISLPIGVAIWYTHSQVQHECSALDLLIAIPAPKPTDPAANPSRELNYRFHQALVQWHDENGC